MPANVEIKAPVRDMETLRAKVMTMAAGEGVLLKQEDIFYNVPDGRLKLRLVDGRGELIFYRRGGATEPKVSQYRIVRFDDPQSIRALLGDALGERAVVRKSSPVLG